MAVFLWILLVLRFRGHFSLLFCHKTADPAALFCGKTPPAAGDYLVRQPQLLRDLEFHPVLRL